MTMQSSPSPSTLDSLFPNVATQQMQAQRQLALAQMLMQQGAQGTDALGQTEMAGKLAIAKSPLEGLGDLAKTAAGLYGQQQGTEMMANAAQLRAQQLGQLLGGSAAGTPDQALAGGEAQGDVGPTNTNAARIGTQTEPTAQGGGPGGFALPGINPKTMQLAFMLAPEEAIKAALGAQAPTDAVKQLASAYGYGTPQFTQALQQLARKTTENVENLRGGNTLYDMNTGTPLFTAPDTEGRVINWTAGRPSLGNLPTTPTADQNAASPQDLVDELRRRGIVQ